MAHAASPALVRQLGSLFDGDSAAGLSDRQLLERFVARRDPTGEDAFAVLVARHGPMVLGVCRQLLGDRQHAEDAFQAVFLVLARKARSLREPELLGPWLYGVALRTARKDRGRLVRRRRTEQAGPPRQMPAAPADQSLLDREQAEALHREIDRLPQAFRLPVVLCYFEQLTLDEAAQRLRWPAGTLRSRLARAREKLRRGLVRRGVALSGSALAGMFTSRSASASVSPLLCDTTTRAATAFAAGQAIGLSAASALARAVLRRMLVQKLRFAAVSLVLLAAGAGALSGVLAMNDEPKDPPPASGPAPGRMTVVGRVVDPQGLRVPNARVMVYGARKQGGGNDPDSATAPGAMGQEASDGSGLFRIDAPRLSSATHHEVGVAAIAPGYGVGWVDLDLDADQPDAEITLRPEQVIEGRLFDVYGRPVEGVRVSVEGMGHPSRTLEPLPEQIEGGPVFWDGDSTKNLPAWPRPAVSDAEGRFTLRGIGRDLRVRVGTDDPRFARQEVVVETDSRPGAKTISMAVEPAKVITGRVTYADTGKPVPHAALAITAMRGRGGYFRRYETDAEGVYRANPLSAVRYAVYVYAPDGQPYLNVVSETFAWPKGALEHHLDLVLSRGKVIRGRVVEEGSNRPVAGAKLGFVTRLPSGGGDGRGPVNGYAQSGADGSYQLAVLPRAGTLIVLGPSENFVLRERGMQSILQGRPGGRRWYAHAFIDCDMQPGGDVREANVALRRGRNLKVRVLGPDGQPVPEAWIFSRTLALPQPVPWRFWWGESRGNVRNGQCALHGLDPGAEIPVSFLDPKRMLGATILVSGKSSDMPLTVRLEPCGTARGRIVDPAGKPLAGYRDPRLVSMVVTPGPGRLSPDPADKDRLWADQDYLSRIDLDHYRNGPAADSQGQITFPALIPGATYRAYDTTQVDSIGNQLRKEFVARPGETLDLGDIVIARPRE